MLFAAFVLICAALTGVCAGLGAIAWHRCRHLEAEVIELHAVIDVIFLRHGQLPPFAARYDLDYVLDPMFDLGDAPRPDWGAPPRDE